MRAGIWVLGLGRGPDDTPSRGSGGAPRRGEPGAEGGGASRAGRGARFVRRTDDGALGGIGVRLEPEPFVGTHEAFVYYNYWDPASGRTGLRRAATGLLVGQGAAR